MKPTYEFGPELLDNADAFTDAFTDAFFERFTLKHAPQPIKLNDEISKNYLFPTFYGDVTCAQAIFMCSYKKAAEWMIHSGMKPVRMTRGRALVAFSCYIYRNVLGVPAYNEIAMTIPVMMQAPFSPPVLPLVKNNMKGFGYYVFSMPVTSEENNIRGHRIWGLPKVVQEIRIEDRDEDCLTTACEGDTGQTYFELRVPKTGSATHFDVCSDIYSKLDGEVQSAKTYFTGEFQVRKHMSLLLRKNVQPERTYLTLSDTPSGRMLKNLEIEAQPLQTRYAHRMSSCFDLPDPDYRAMG